MKYVGVDKRSGEHIISNLEKITQVKLEQGEYNLYIGKERFATFREDQENTFFLDTNRPNYISNVKVSR